jgi:flagellar basal body rod protein FlgB
MDPVVTARYGLLAAERRFEAAALRIASERAGDDVDLGQEVVEMVQAKHHYSANLNVLRFAQDMWRSLLEIQVR